MSEDKMEQAALIAKYWDGKLPVVIADIVQNVINEKQSQLRTLAEAVLEAHFDYGGCGGNCTFATASGCTATDKVECDNICKCPACTMAREILEARNE